MRAFEEALFKIEKRVARREKPESGVFTDDDASLDLVASRTCGCGWLDLDDVIVGHRISCYRQPPVFARERFGKR